MPFLKSLASLWRNLFMRSRVERDLEDELRSYLDESVEAHRASGMTPAEALRAARINMDGLEQVKEEVRQVSSGHMVEQLLQDLRYGFRTLRKDVTFTAVAVLALALGIGANTVMFSVAYGVLARPLPYPQADRLAVISMRYSPRDNPFGTLCIRDYLTWKQNNRTFEDPALFRGLRMDVAGKEGYPEQVQGASVTAGFFTTLGVTPLIGRALATGEDQPGAPSFAVLSESIWRRRFNARFDILGQTIVVNGAASTVIGVMPASFLFPTRATDVWTNLRIEPPTRYGPWFYRGIARLKPGVTLERAQTEMNAIGLQMMQQNSYYKHLTLPVRNLRDALLGTSVRPAILMLIGAVGLVLMIAVVNVANLMLARATVREREMALRLSLGAGRARLVRQLLTESVLLSGIGAAAGLALAWVSIELIRVWNPGNLPLIDSVRLDAAALSFADLVAVLTGILFGLAPALQSSRADLNSTIKQDGRSGAGSRRGRTRSALVVAEIAASVMLLVAAGLLLRSFVKLQQVDGGFAAAPRRVLTMLISPGNVKYNDARAGLAFYDEVLRRARNVPGVESAAVTDTLPPDRQGDADSFEIEGQALPPGEMNPVVSDATVSPEFFQVLGIPLVKGRYFTTHDTADSAPVTVVSQAFARRYFPNREPLGKRIKQSGPGFGNPWREIVGVVGNVKYLGLTADADQAYYLPFAQSYGPRINLVVRTSGDAAPLVETLRRDLQAIDPGATLAQIGTMEQALRLSIAQPRFNTVLLGLFAAIALLLAAIGIYGLIAYSVARRTHEIGVRMALGAARADVVRMVLRQGASLAIVGIAIGIGGAFFLTHLLKSMLFGIAATDALTFVAAPVGLMAAVLVAMLVPTLRATRISPVVALRCE
jgi:putative ABC transport system permease protein